MDTTAFLQANRSEIIKRIELEIKRCTGLYGKAKCDLKTAMIVYKEVLVLTENAGKAREASEKAIKGNLRLSRYANLSDQSLGQLPSWMR